MEINSFQPSPGVVSAPQKPELVLPKPSNFLSKLKSFWERKKVMVVLIAIALMSLAFFVLRLFVLSNKDKVNDDLLTRGWKKLVLDEQYTPLYVLTPNHQSKFGIISKDTFTFSTKEATDESFIKANLMSSRPINIKKISDTQFEISPLGNLSPGETISILMKDNGDYRWTFQAAPELAVISNIPRDKAVNVPINAGIEITFNNDNYDLQSSYVNINPRIDFKIEKRDEKATIIPSNPLQPKTAYTVTIKKGLALFSGNNSLPDDYSFSFQTAEATEKSARINLAKDFQEVFPDEHLITKVYTKNWVGDLVVNAEIYKFSSADEFISSRSNLDTIASSWMTYYGENDMVNTKNLARVATADLEVQEKDKLQYLELPQNLDEGLYLVQFWFDNYKKVEQLWVQSSSIAGYVSVGKLQTVVWVNSSKNESLGSATIGIIGTGNTFSTNDDGWSTFPTPQVFFDGKTRHYLQIVSTGSKKIIIPVANLSDEAKPGDLVNDDYWTYLYNERVLYKPNDTVYFWGVVKNRDTGAPPSSIDIYLGDNLNQSVTPLSDGSFIGKIQLKDASIGYTSISSKINGTSLSESYFSISQYVKPEFEIEVQTEKKAIYAGEAVNFKAKIGFFDGTPASNANLKLSARYGKLEKTEVSANRNGEVAFKYQSEINGVSDFPRYEGVTVSSDQSGEGLSDGSASVLVYGSRLGIKKTGKQNGSQANLSATVNTLDLDLINNKGLNDPTSGIAANQKVSITTTKKWYEKKEYGTYYDFVEKISKPNYEYIEHKDMVDSKDLYTDSNGNITYSFNMDLNSSYIVVLSTTDSQGGKASATNYFYYSEYRNNPDGSDQVTLNLNRDSNAFSLGDVVDITIQKNGTDYQKQAGSKFLFILANRGKQDVIVKDSPEFKFIFKEEDIPEVYVGSIIFTGRHYEEVSSTCKSGWNCNYYPSWHYNAYLFDPLLIQYKSDDSKLDVAISTDKLKYNPGETAIVNVKVTKNGNVVGGASVQLTAVDEALAAIDGVKKPSILATLYKHISNMIYYNYYSHKPALPDGSEAEQGGGGGGRDLFKDTAFFSGGITDANGDATFSVTLPDNITNWLTYAQAITGGVDAGQAESSIVATQDFFMTNQFPSTMLTKDAPVVAINSWGNALNQNSKVSAVASFIKNNAEISQKSLTIDAFKEGYVEFPKLEAGLYRVAVSGAYQNYKDGITLPLETIDSRLDFATSVEKTLQGGDSLTTFGDIKPKLDKPIKLVLTDEGKGKYFYNLLSYCYQDSNNLERLISSLKAKSVLETRFKDKTPCSGVSTDLSLFQTSDGGLSQVQWGGSDLETTVWAIYVDPTPFNKEKLVNYLTSKSSYITADNILVNWGLTLLGEPRINQLNTLSLQASTYEEKVLAALAMETVGNTEKAKELYINILSKYAYVNEQYMRIQADPKKVDYNIYAKDTSYALLLGTLIGIEDYTSRFNSYLGNNSGDAMEVSLDVANITYLDAVLAKIPDADTTVSYKSDVQKVSKNISKDGYLSLNITPSELKNFSLNIIDGKVDALLHYYITPETFASLKTDDRISLKRSVKKVRGDGTGYKIGDILQIDLKYNFDSKAPPGCYMLTDHIPSGMKYIENPKKFGLSTGSARGLYETKRNIVKGCAYNSFWWEDYSKNTSSYFVRVTSAGKFVEEPAIIQSSLNSSIFQKTSEEYITVDR